MTFEGSGMAILFEGVVARSPDNGVAQLLQNRAVSVLSERHFGHFMALFSCSRKYHAPVALSTLGQ